VHDRRGLLEQFHPVEFALKVVAVGSVGTCAWIALMLANDGKDPPLVDDGASSRAEL
jgi:Uncharacterized protein conserved in bacteria (DUF2252)